MERLTKRGTRKDGYVSAIGSGLGCWGKIIDRLSAYEDTGLEPKGAQKISNVFRQISEEYNCWFDFAVKCVLEKANELQNTPLTLEELWEMDGEPVWNDTTKKWYFVVLHWEYGPVAVDYKGNWRPLDDRYYRRKPEEGTA